MSATGTNYTTKWVLESGVLTISPTSGNSGVARMSGWSANPKLINFITLTDSEMSSVTEIVFVGSISFYMGKLLESGYEKITSLWDFFQNFSYSQAFPNLDTLDITGLDSSGVTNFEGLFNLSNLVTLTGLLSLDVSSGVNFASMFKNAKLSSLDVSNFPLNNATTIQSMFEGMRYCETITLPSNFSRTSTNDYKGAVFGLASVGSFGSEKINATKGDVTITSDEDFFRLDSAQGGTWTRDVSGTATLSFRVTGTQRTANVATINYSYATNTATAEIYAKKTSESSYPSTAIETISLSSTGNDSIDITLATDDAYDFKIVVSDGTTTIYTYPAVSSNILLFEISEEGKMQCSNFYPVGSVYVGSTNTDPADILGFGTWTLIRKMFADKAISISGSGSGKAIQFNSTNTRDDTTSSNPQNRTADVVRKGEQIMIRLRWFNKVAVSDGNQVICTINGAELGFDSQPYYIYLTGDCDGVNGIPILCLTWSGTTGTLTQVDVVTRAASYPTTVNQAIHATMILMFTSENMLDSACNEFHWKRTA